MSERADRPSLVANIYLVRESCNLESAVLRLDRIVSA